MEVNTDTDIFSCLFSLQILSYPIIIQSKIRQRYRDMNDSRSEWETCKYKRSDLTSGWFTYRNRKYKNQ